MTVKLASIKCKAPDQYEAQLEDLNTGQKRAFDFTVEMVHGIPLVTWTSEFSAYMQQNLSPASPLMEAVRQFHCARKIDFP
jgi:hypothetical protein